MERGLCLATATLCLGACSALLVDRPPRAVRSGDVPGHCSDQVTWPAVDAALAVAALAAGAGVASGLIEPRADDGAMSSVGGDEPAVGAIVLAEGVFFAWSAYWGWTSTRACAARTRAEP